MTPRRGTPLGVNLGWRQRLGGNARIQLYDLRSDGSAAFQVPAQPYLTRSHKFEKLVSNAV